MAKTKGKGKARTGQKAQLMAENNPHHQLLHQLYNQEGKIVMTPEQFKRWSAAYVLQLDLKEGIKAALLECYSANELLHLAKEAEEIHQRPGSRIGDAGYLFLLAVAQERSEVEERERGEQEDAQQLSQTLEHMTVTSAPLPPPPPPQLPASLAIPIFSMAVPAAVPPSTSAVHAELPVPPAREQESASSAQTQDQQTSRQPPEQSFAGLSHSHPAPQDAHSQSQSQSAPPVTVHKASKTFQVLVPFARGTSALPIQSLLQSATASSSHVADIEEAEMAGVAPEEEEEDGRMEEHADADDGDLEMDDDDDAASSSSLPVVALPAKSSTFKRLFTKCEECGESYSLKEDNAKEIHDLTCTGAQI